MIEHLFTCDRCGAEGVRRLTEASGTPVGPPDRWRILPLMPGKTVTLCDQCLASLQTWMAHADPVHGDMLVLHQ